jgi:hypothetical protein
MRVHYKDKLVNIVREIIAGYYDSQTKPTNTKCKVAEY